MRSSYCGTGYLNAQAPGQKSGLFGAKITFNFEAAGDGRVLLNLEGLGTVLHEIGHALERILTPNDRHDSSLDLREVSSQFFESFIKDYSVVKQISRHERTGGKITQKMFTAAYNSYCQEEVEQDLARTCLALIDLEIHSNRDSDIAGAINELKPLIPYYAARTWEENFVIRTLLGSSASTGKGNFYSYVFSKALAVNLFSEFRGK